MFIHFTDHKVEKCGNLEAESTTQKKHQTKKKSNAIKIRKRQIKVIIFEITYKRIIKQRFLKKTDKCKGQ